MLHARNEAKVLTVVPRYEYDETDVPDGQALGVNVDGAKRYLCIEIQSW